MLNLTDHDVFHPKMPGQSIVGLLGGVWIQDSSRWCNPLMKLCYQSASLDEAFIASISAFVNPRKELQKPSYRLGRNSKSSPPQGRPSPTPPRCALRAAEPGPRVRRSHRLGRRSRGLERPSQVPVPKRRPGSKRIVLRRVESDEHQTMGSTVERKIT